MKLTKSLVITAGLILATLSHAATPGDEARFLTAVRDAYIKKDKDAVIALTCWDNVTEKHRSRAPIALEKYAFSRLLKSAEYVFLDPAEDMNLTKDGVTYSPNLVIIKKIQLVYEDFPDGGQMKSSLFIGEKSGKLMIVNLAPRP